jgi:hypothetical protein
MLRRGQDGAGTSDLQSYSYPTWRNSRLSRSESMLRVIKPEASAIGREDNDSYVA